MKLFQTQITTLTKNNMLFFEKNSLLVMLYKSKEHCEDDRERNAVDCIIKAFQQLKDSN